MNSVHIFENIGYKCQINENTIILTSVLANYKTFQANHVGAYVPYLVRDSKTKQYEVGVGQLSINNNIYIIDKYKTISSSNENNHPITANDCEFYIFANEYNFNTAFTNVILKDSNFDIDNVRAIYIVDVTDGDLWATLPSASDNPSLVVDLKIINNDIGKLHILHNENIVHTLQGSQKYVTIASTGKDWVVLQDNKISSFGIQSTDNMFSAQSTPGGEVGEIQYKVDDNSWGGANTFFGTDNKLLLGSNSETTANIILPTSGNVEHDTIFNNGYTNSGNFIINGTDSDKNFKFGSDGSIGVNIPSGYSIPNSGDIIFFGSQSGNRNLFFAYDGRIGINIPTGSRPQTLAHFVNFACDETLRIENRASCHTADITLFHFPPTQNIPENTDIATITLASKDSTQSKQTYVKLFGRVLDYTDNATSGEFAITVNSGNSLVETVYSNPTETRILTNGAASVLSVDISQIALSSDNIVFSGNSINFFSKDGTSGTINAANAYIADVLTVDTLSLPNLSNNSILTIDDGVVVAASTGNPIAIISAPSGRLLSTTANGIIETDIKIDDLFRTNNDIVYSAFPKRLAEACLSQIIFDETDRPNIEEYSVGDQISIEYSNGDVLYTLVSSITSVGDDITILFTTDQITPSTDSGLRIQSISKGFLLTLRKYVDPDISPVNDATAIVLSTRPNQRTVFNDQQKPIQFTVFTDSDAPALDIRPSELLGNPVTEGQYFRYATNSNIMPLQVLIADGQPSSSPVYSSTDVRPGVGSSNSYNTSNYNFAALGKWSGLLSDVGTNGLPSAYGTFDQNGNAAEWLADNTNEHRSSDYRYIAGGSIVTSGVTFNAFQLLLSTGIASGVGFRVASAYGFGDAIYITGMAEAGNLGLEFVNVQNAKNNPHNTGILVYDPETHTTSETSINHLGRVPYPYRLSKYEVTNYQYNVFLNAVATGTDYFNLYHNMMHDDDTGGITRDGSGPFQYIIKSGHADKPVTFVDYLSALRFTNWLHNGAPTGLTEDPANITESGAYNIEASAGDTYSIVKNQLASYYIPTIHEWYKAAYFKPDRNISTSSSVVIINDDNPYPSAVLTVNGASHINGGLSVSGTISSLGIDVVSEEGHNIIKLYNNQDAAVSIQNAQNSLALVDSENGVLTIGPNPTLIIDEENNQYNGSYRTGFSPDKVTIAADGQIKIMSPQPVVMSGIIVDTIITQDFKISDPNGNIEDFIAGPSGGILYKRGSAQAKAIDGFYYSETDDGVALTGVNISGLSPLYLNNLKYIKTYNYLVYNDDNIECKTLLKILDRDGLQIGDDSENLKGALLVHQGTGPLKFELNSYLEADGLTYSRWPKRLVYVDSINKRVEFVDPIDDIGGIAEELPELEDLNLEYSFGDTVAVMHTGDFEVEYVKLAAQLSGPFDGPDSLYISHPPIFTEDEETNVIYTHFCPKLKPNEKDEGGEEAPGFTGIMYSITRSSILTNGLGYGLFQQDPVATSGFNCIDPDPLSNDDPDATFTFRPSSKSVISTRPMTHTHFNAVGENIDFAIYGRTRTQYNRYIPELHDANPEDGDLPTGLIPVFRVDANIPNATIGTATGIFFSGYIDPNNTIPTGYLLDDVGKATINRNTPYIITSVNKAIDVEPSGYNTLDVLADLSVNQYTYSSGIVTDHIYLSGMHGSEYIPGATLTVDVYGKIVSVSPALPPSVPGPPTNVNGIAGNSSVLLSWTQPIDNGRSPILDYKVEYTLNNGTTWTSIADTVSPETSLLITGLVNDQPYIFRVAAVNTIGQGQWSLNSSSITPTSNVPSDVINLTLTRSSITGGDDERIVAEWSPPTDSGSGPIIRYIIKYKKIDEPSFAGNRTLSLNISALNLVNNRYTYPLQEAGYITTDPHIVVQIYAVNNSGNGSIVQKISYGTDPVDIPTDPLPDDEYDFGEMTFTGECSTT